MNYYPFLRYRWEPVQRFVVMVRTTGTDWFVIDSATGIDSATYLLNEYAAAFGNDGEVKIIRDEDAFFEEPVTGNSEDAATETETDDHAPSHEV